MERSDSEITFDIGEQHEFYVPMRLPVEAAVDKAIYYLHISKTIAYRNNDPVHGILQPAAAQARNNRLARAQRLHGFYIQIEQLCPDEALQRLAEG